MDLTSSYVGRNVAVLTSVALVIIVGLFVVQVIAAALRREPGGLARAITGAGAAVHEQHRARGTERLEVGWALVAQVEREPGVARRDEQMLGDERGGQGQVCDPPLLRR